MGARAQRDQVVLRSAGSSLPPVRSVAPRHAGGAGLHAHATGAQPMRSYPGDSTTAKPLAAVSMFLVPAFQPGCGSALIERGSPACRAA
ncbi:hypothetical protein IA54_009570 [Xanthomonas phaseoli pv. syngonii LMG 9055]|uniref:Uncharacterized protein n=1 Tax=Xanthomonas phaseoli pv. syngonii LMG 9055 TaxID=1437878 RepID=A0A1V9GZI0_9XANT|nr:hypothetical protein IA54_009570 [Xanthomonas phaseoli pv. syngonii LMG 9055]